ncbi:MAG TPA: rhomboid family intramembrane serine protease [Thermoanaerobaculia bacterium]|jgi:rhomboid protease GluP|nr:rhomboid family intramembrane serine protease [Thermoanaerobaculia bacterium]
MFERQRSGSVLCPSCGRLVGVNEKQCPFCGRRSPGMFGLNQWLRRLGADMGFVDAVMGGCVLLYLLMLATDPQGIRTGGGLMSLLSPSLLSLLRFGASGSVPVFLLHRWWTLLAAGWLHGSLLHIGFNLYAVRFFAPAIAELYGPSRMVIIYSVSSVTGFLLSSTMGLLHLGGAPLTVGASAPILGLVGAMVYYGRRGGSRAISSQAWGYVVSVVVFGFFMRRYGIDNYAHLGGFVGGYLAGRLLDPLKPERGDHQVAALILLGLTAASVLLSLVVRIPPGLVE